MHNLLVLLTNLLPSFHLLNFNPNAPSTALGHKHPHPKHCKLLSSVTYHNQWGPQFIENDYFCDLPTLSDAQLPIPLPIPLDPHEASPRRKGGGRGGSTSPQQKRQQHTHINPPPANKHQIKDFSCDSLPHAKPLDPTKGASLLYTLTQLSNQSCIPPGHLREYTEIPRSWSADWSFTNLNRGDETICDWYTELANVAQALHYYCENSLEREVVDGGWGEAVGYGRDSERKGQVWCMRYSNRGWGEEAFERKCLALDEDEEWGGEVGSLEGEGEL
ncbi:hypothetical protein DFH27DRAFT_475191 [Peziza echinospora]|nr:hypothetical protein DFH27DRAFT_475191 [Peziza echinospora]